MYGWVNWQIISIVMIYSHYIFLIDVVKYVLMSLQYCSKWRLVSAGDCCKDMYLVTMCMESIFFYIGMFLALHVLF